MNPVLIRNARLQTPFRSFILKTKDGRWFPVAEPEHVLVTTNLLVVVDPASRAPTHVSPDEIDTLEYVDKSSESWPDGHRSHS